jgi:hypothetical protein
MQPHDLTLLRLSNALAVTFAPPHLQRQRYRDSVLSCEPTSLSTVNPPKVWPSRGSLRLAPNRPSRPLSLDQGLDAIDLAYDSEPSGLIRDNRQPRAMR